MNENKLIFGLTFVVLFCGTLFGAYAAVSIDEGIQVAPDNVGVTFNTGELEIFVPSDQVPFYFLTELSTNITYKVQFHNMFEISDLDGDGEYNQGNDSIVPTSSKALASFNWSISDIDNETDSDGNLVATHFNLTGSYNGLTVQFRNHIDMVNGLSLKFDVVINSYNFIDDNASLVLAYMITSSDPDYDGTPKDANDTVTFGRGFFSSLPSAEDINGTNVASIATGLSTGSDGGNGMVYLTYEHFDGDLVHDPTIGVEQGPPGGEKTFAFGDIEITVPSDQVPFFSFKNASATDSYQVKFFLMFEATDVDADGIYDDGNDTIIAGSHVALASMDWALSDILNETDGSGNIVATHFNITGTATVANSNDPDLFVQFRIHIDQTMGNAFKFDLVVKNKSWASDANDTMLVLGYLISTTDPEYDGKPDLAPEGRASFGKGYFQSNVTATDVNGTELATGLSVASGNSTDQGMIYQSYGHFESDMVHDPIMGLESDSGDTETETSETATDTTTTTKTSTTSEAAATSEATTNQQLPLAILPLLMVLVTLPLMRNAFRKTE